MQYIHPVIITLHGGTVLTTSLADPKAMTNSPYSETIEYINGFLNATITVTNRHGVSISIPPDPPFHGKYNNLFVIRRHIVIDSSCMQSVISSLVRLDDKNPDTDDVVRCMRHALGEDGTPDLRFGRYEVYLDTVITYDDLRKCSGTVYSRETDLVVSMAGSGTRHVHPHSLEHYRCTRLVNELNGNNPASLVYKIEIVDNFGRFGRRFVRIASEVYAIDPIKDVIRRDGVYVTKNTPSLGNVSYSELHETYYSLEDGEKELLLFRSYEEAKVDGDLSAQRKKEAADLEYQTTKMKMEANRQAAKDRLVPDNLKKIIEIIKPMSVLLVSIFGGVKIIYGLGKAAGAAKK